MVDRGFRTLVLNRTRRGGMLAPGAALIKRGENDGGVASRWYPDTLIKRLRATRQHADRLTICEADGVEAICMAPDSRAGDAIFFVDPPYTAGGKRAGARLYAHHAVDRAASFATLADGGVNFLTTCDCSPEVISLVRRHGLHAETVEMRNGHHAHLRKLVITPFGGVAVGGGEHDAGAAEAGDGLGAVAPVEVAQSREHLDAEDEAAAELAALGEAGPQARELMQGGQFVEDDPDAAPVVAGEREQRVDGDLEPSGDEAPEAGVLVVARGQEQEAAAPSFSIQSRMENGAPWPGSSSRAAMLAVSMARTERAVLGGGIDDGLRHGALHGLGEGVEAGLEQVFDEDPVAGLAALPEHGDASVYHVLGGVLSALDERRPGSAQY